MPTTVSIPGLGEVDFPDSMSREEISIQSKRLYDEAQGGSEPATFTKLAEPSGVSKAVSAVTENPYVQGAASMVKKAALPMAGQAAGLYAGTALGGLPGGVIGESVGGGIGEMANQMAGITEPSIGEVVTAALSGPAARGVAGALRLGAGSLVKAIGGRQNITDIATEVVTKLFGPKTSSHELFENAAKVSGFIPTYRAAKTVDALLDAEKLNPSATSQTIKDAITRWKTTFQTIGSTTNAHEAQKLATYAQDLRLEASAAYAAKNHRLGNALNDLRGALFDDAAAAGAPEFSIAAKAFRREVNVDKLAGIMRQANPVKAFDDLMGSHAPKDKLFKTEFSEAEQAQIKSILNKLSTAAPSGFSGVLGRTITGGGASMTMSDPITKAAAFTFGFVAPDIAAYALTTRVGRNFIERLLVGSVWDAPKAAALTQFVRAQRAEDAKSGDIAAAVKASLKSRNTSIENKINAAKIGAGQGGMAESMRPIFQ